MTIDKDRVVSIHYKLTNDDGEVIDSSEGTEPLTYLHGAANIIPGLEKELTGKKVGDSLKVTVKPEDGYGEVNPELIQIVPAETFKGVDKLEPGMHFQADSPDGHAMMIVVEAVNGDEITVNGNHPLAGQVLHFDVTVDSIREATPEEIDHGHVH